MIEKKNESVTSYKLKNIYFDSYHGQDIILNKIDVSKNIQKRLAIIYKFALQERQKLPFELKNEIKDLLESKEICKFTRVKYEYKKELEMGDEMDLFAKKIQNSLRRILDDVIVDIDKFKVGLDYDAIIFKLMNDKEKKVIYKIRKSNYFERNIFDNIYQMSLCNRFYYIFKLFKFLYINVNKDDFFNTRISLYSYVFFPCLSYILLRYNSRTRLIKFLIPINLILSSYIFTSTFREDLRDINLRKTDLSEKLIDLSKI